MKKLLKSLLFVGVFTILICGCQQKSYQIPHLKRQGKTTQLIVDEKPFLILGGELGNSSFTSLEYMAQIKYDESEYGFSTCLLGTD